MKADHKRESGYDFPLARMMWSLMVAGVLLIGTQAPAGAASIDGGSMTIFRLGESTADRKLRSLYEYLNLSGSTKAGDSGTVSFNAGGWGRLDLGDKSFNDKYADGDLQYGYLSYRGEKSNLLFNAGRQFVAEGVAAERIDGIYFHSDLAAGFGAAVYAGAPVVVTPVDLKGGDTIYGGRISHSDRKYYSVALSALRTDYNGSHIREEEGVDLWIHPIKRVDLVGRTSYNSITSAWMNHDYALSYIPLDQLRLNASVSYISYRDFFFQVTNPALSLTTGLLNPDEKVWIAGGSLDFLPVKYLTLTVDYKKYKYEIAGQANQYGGKATVSWPENFAAGLSIHRMEGENSSLRYDKYRVFGEKRLGKIDLIVDLLLVNYESAIKGVTKSYSASGAISYAITENLRAAADIEYMKDPDFDNAVAGLFKVIYAFDKTLGAEGRAKK